MQSEKCSRKATTVMSFIDGPLATLMTSDRSTFTFQGELHIHKKKTEGKRNVYA